jgi:hypothetical protein
MHTINQYLKFFVACGAADRAEEAMGIIQRIVERGR